MTDDLDRAVIEAAEAWAGAYDDRRASDGTILMTTVGRQLYEAVKARQRALRPSRIDVIRRVFDEEYWGPLETGALPEAINEALTKWEQGES